MPTVYIQHCVIKFVNIRYSTSILSCVLDIRGGSVSSNLVCQLVYTSEACSRPAILYTCVQTMCSMQQPRSPLPNGTTCGQKGCSPRTLLYDNAQNILRIVFEIKGNGGTQELHDTMKCMLAFDHTCSIDVSPLLVLCSWWLTRCTWKRLFPKNSEAISIFQLREKSQLLPEYTSSCPPIS